MPLLTSLTRAGLLAGTVLLPAALRAQDPEDALLAAERAASESSAKDGFLRAIESVLASDGAILWPGAPVVHGRDQVHRLLTAQRVLDTLRISWQPFVVEVSRDGTLGVTWGVAVALRNGAPQIGRYIAAWQQENGAWKLAALVPLGLVPPNATALPADLGPMRLTPLRVSGPAARFIAADIAFAQQAGDSGAAVAFERFAAPEAMTMGGGILNRGPAAIRRTLEGGPPSTWKWAPVLAGAAASGDLGWTVGESEITPQGASMRPGKYLTIWRMLPNGQVGYLTDGGTPRPVRP